MSYFREFTINGVKIGFMDTSIVLEFDFDLSKPENAAALSAALLMGPFLSAYFWAESLDMEDKKYISGMYDEDVEKAVEAARAALEMGYRFDEDIATFHALLEAKRNQNRIRAENETLLKTVRATKRGGYVYLLRSDVGRYKIGRTVNPADRIRTFSVKLPFEVSYEHIIPCEDMVSTERELHARFATKRVNGEWFELAPEDVAYIKSLGGES